MENDLRKKVYQMFILGLEEDYLSENSNLYKALKEGLGGVILFTRNIKTIEQTKKLNKDIKKTAFIPPFLSIDEEGGRVERTENIFGGKKFLSAKFSAQKGKNFIKEQTEQISHLLKEMEFNLNYAPCLDVNSNPKNPIIGERAFSENTEEVINYGKIVNETYLKNGIITCGKHFPGHGDADVDSHIELPVIDLSKEELEKKHIKPFLEVNPPMIMAAHLHCKAFDKEKIPSSLSKNVIGYLKNTYDGLIITDDMVMGGVKGQTGVQNALDAINAGVNLLLYRNSDIETINVIENVLLKAVKDDELQRKISISYQKIVDFKEAKKGWEYAKEAIESGKYQLVILDEINICIAMNMLKVSDIKETLMNKPENLEIVLTGRYAHPELKAMAHLVTEMKPIKHYFDMGVMARQGIEY